MSENKRLVERLLAEAPDDLKDYMQRVAMSPVMHYYLLPAQEVDSLHRVFMQSITKNRKEFIAIIEAEQEALKQAAEHEAITDESE